MDYFFYIWLLLSLLFFLVELSFPGLFFFLSFSIGAFASFILGLLGSSVHTQWYVFLVVSVFSCAALYYIARIRLGQFKISADHKFNVDSLLGRRATVITTIPAGEGFGFIKLGGEVWMARSVYDEVITIGTSVEVLYIKGAHAVVKKRLND